VVVGAPAGAGDVEGYFAEEPGAGDVRDGEEQGQIERGVWRVEGNSLEWLGAEV